MFHQVSKHDKTVWNMSAKRECFIVYESLDTLMKHNDSRKNRQSNFKVINCQFSLIWVVIAGR